jgi:hypothetical protein
VRRLLLSERQAQLEFLLSEDSEAADNAKTICHFIDDFLTRFDDARELSDDAISLVPPEGNHYMEMSSDPLED